MYWAKTPSWFRKIYPKDLVWDMPAENEPSVYITFDDGPHPVATLFAMEYLEKYGAKATFFCVGNNVSRYPDIYQQLLKGGHTTGNHTFDHVSGWKMSSDAYLRNITRAKAYINSTLFRPPYGRIKYSQIRKLKRAYPSWKIVMWDILSCDFDKAVTPQQCVDNVLMNIRPGSIVIFHDSDKAWERMRYALPQVLEYCQKQNWKMKVLPQ
jgi:peptidoglycan-N-acetylglucosamine deacetylase